MTTEEYANLWIDSGIEKISKPAFKNALPLKSPQKQVTKLLFVGERTDGAAENDLLNKVIEAMGYKSEDIPIVKLPVSKTQIEEMNPAMIVALGLTASQELLGSEISFNAVRGKFSALSWNGKIPVMPTYAPSFLLKNPAAKKDVWNDMKLVMNKMKSL